MAFKSISYINNFWVFHPIMGFPGDEMLLLKLKRKIPRKFRLTRVRNVEFVAQVLLDVTNIILKNSVKMGVYKTLGGL